METNLTKEIFEKEVLTADKAVLVDFWATWCAPCQMLSPVVAEFAEEHPEIKVCKVNVDNEPELAIKYGISSIPALLLFKNGEVAATTVGFCTKNELEEFVK